MNDKKYLMEEEILVLRTAQKIIQEQGYKYSTTIYDILSKDSLCKQLDELKKACDY